MIFCYGGSSKLIQTVIVNLARQGRSSSIQGSDNQKTGCGRMVIIDTPNVPRTRESNEVPSAILIPVSGVSSFQAVALKLVTGALGWLSWSDS